MGSSGQESVPEVVELPSWPYDLPRLDRIKNDPKKDPQKVIPTVCNLGNYASRADVACTQSLDSVGRLMAETRELSGMTSARYMVTVTNGRHGAHRECYTHELGLGTADGV